MISNQTSTVASLERLSEIFEAKVAPTKRQSKTIELSGHARVAWPARVEKCNGTNCSGNKSTKPASLLKPHEPICCPKHTVLHAEWKMANPSCLFDPSHYSPRLADGSMPPWRALRDFDLLKLLPPDRLVAPAWTVW